MSIRIIVGDCRTRLRELAEQSVNVIVTSPPYFQQRDYQVAGQLGMNQSPDEYIDDLAGIFDECWRVLRDDGLLFVNIGDSYAQKGGAYSLDGSRGHNSDVGKGGKANLPRRSRKPPSGCKAKDLIGIPWMLAFELRRRGWYLRQENIWGKPNGMPESTDDRTTRSHETVFMLAKSHRYFYDASAVRTAPAPSTLTRLAQKIDQQAGSDRANAGQRRSKPMKAVLSGTTTLTGGPWGKSALGDNAPAGAKREEKQRGHSRRHKGFNERWDKMSVDEQRAKGANLRSVWWIAPANFGEEHYAVMPDDLAEICILAGCPAGGTVLDPFGGAGTTGLVADRHLRNAILIELNPKYAAMARDRIKADGRLLTDIEIAA